MNDLDSIRSNPKWPGYGSGFGERYFGRHRASPEAHNHNFALHNEDFKKACRTACIPPTKRQASKYRRGYGLAFSSAQSSVCDDAKRICEQS